MLVNNKLKIVFILIGLDLAYTLDRITKLGFIKTPDYFTEFFGWLPFSITPYHNTGSMFGLSAPLNLLVVLSILLLFIILAMIVKSIRSKNYWQFLAWGLVLIGGLSNLWDRFAYGFVIDWWQMPWQAVINLADVYISAGVILLIFLLKKDSNSNQA